MGDARRHAHDRARSPRLGIFPRSVLCAPQNAIARAREYNSSFLLPIRPTDPAGSALISPQHDPPSLRSADSEVDTGTRVGVHRLAGGLPHAHPARAKVGDGARPVLGFGDFSPRAHRRRVPFGRVARGARMRSSDANLNSEAAAGSQCDWCRETCDPDVAELNALTCTFAECPPEASVYHQDCLEKYLKSIKLDKCVEPPASRPNADARSRFPNPTKPERRAPSRSPHACPDPRIRTPTPPTQISQGWLQMSARMRQEVRVRQAVSRNGARAVFPPERRPPIRPFPERRRRRRPPPSHSDAARLSVLLPSRSSPFRRTAPPLTSLALSSHRPLLRWKSPIRSSTRIRTARNAARRSPRPWRPPPRLVTAPRRRRRGKPPRRRRGKSARRNWRGKPRREERRSVRRRRRRRREPPKQSPPSEKPPRRYKPKN